MKRDLNRFEGTTYDLVVIGAGIHGACVARDAALRGLRVVLIDRGDFGNATSHNSLKLIHGGIRYLQHLDLRRVRESIRERRFWLSMAPHLIRPLKLVIPTYGHWTRGPEAFSIAFKMYDLISSDRNRGVIVDRQIPSCEVISKEKCLKLIPGLESKGLTGGAIWYDGQMEDSDRILLDCVSSAVEAGAEVANYIAVEGFLGNENSVEGVLVRDVLKDYEFSIRAKVTVNTCGPWIWSVLQKGFNNRRLNGNVRLAKSMNLVTRRFIDDYAIGVVSARKSDSIVDRSRRLYFITPWRNRAVIGTSHFPYEGDPDECKFTEEDIDRFLTEINDAYPPAKLTREDVYYSYGGMTPADEGQTDGEVKRNLHSEIINHETLHQISGLVSVAGVKYTTARLVAERGVDLVFRKLGINSPPCATMKTPFLSERDLVNTETLIGEGEYNDAFSSGDLHVDHASETTLQSFCRYAVREEMAVRLADIIFRRTDLAERGVLGKSFLNWVAQMMRDELGWTKDRMQKELEDVHAQLVNHHFNNPGSSNFIQQELS